MATNDEVDKLFFEFIWKLNEAGHIAHSEEKGSNFQATNKKLVLETLKEYQELLDEVNTKFNNLKAKTQELYSL